MITLYSGSPGSGKSLHLAREVRDELIIRKKTVIANFPINMEYITRMGKRKSGDFYYLPNDQLTVDYLVSHAKQYHKAGKEGQTLVVIDEAGVMFNSRDYGCFDRKSWVNFFMTHRHYGFNVILVSQVDRLIDRQIRAFIEYDIIHRKANNFKLIGLLLTMFRIPLFVAVTTWYGIREKCGSELFRFRKSDAKLYDTMMLFGSGQHGESVGSEAVKNEKKRKKPPRDTDGAGGTGGPAPAGTGAGLIPLTPPQKSYTPSDGEVIEMLASFINGGTPAKETPQVLTGREWLYID
jgi:KaiC/GvpD/RAD55 family RecA-like ATPase